MSQLIQFVCNDTTWAILSAGLFYLAGAWLQPLVAKLPPSNRAFKLIRLAHRILNKVDPDGNDVGKAVALLLAFVCLSQSACTASFEEARLVGIRNAHETRVDTQVTSTDTKPATATRNDATCQAIDRRHRIWGGIEYGALAITGASGLSTIPVNDDTGRTALAITAVVFATAAAVSKFEDNTATTAWAEQCAAK